MTIVASAGNKVHGNLYGCDFLFFRNRMEIDVILKRLVYCDSCKSVVSNTSAHTETISEN